MFFAWILFRMVGHICPVIIQFISWLHCSRFFRRLAAPYVVAVFRRRSVATQRPHAGDMGSGRAGGEARQQRNFQKRPLKLRLLLTN